MARRRNPMAAHHIDHTAYMERVKTLSDSALRYVINDAAAAIRAMPDGHKAGYYADEIHYCSDELTKRRRVARRNPVMMNPTRTGAPTRGEMRKVKFLDYLRSVREKGKKAEMQLKRLTGKGKIDLPPVLRADKTETQLEHPGHYAAELTSDQKFKQARIDEIENTMADIREQMRGLGDDDETLADELTAQLMKLGKQKAALREPAVATNPRRRRVLGSLQKRAYTRALRQWCGALCCLPVGAKSGRGKSRHRRC